MEYFPAALCGGFPLCNTEQSSSLEQPFTGILYSQVPIKVPNQGSEEDWRKYRPAAEWFRGPDNR